VTERYELRTLHINGWDIDLVRTGRDFAPGVPEHEWVVRYLHHPRAADGRRKPWKTSPSERREPFRSPYLHEALNYAVAYTQVEEYEGEREDIRAYLSRIG
jgi:hypothetical protein